MSQWNPSGQKAYEAAADLRTKQYLAVKLDTNQKVVLATAATDKIIGILLNAPNLGETCDIALLNAGGTVKVLAGEVISTYMNRLTIDSTSRVIVATQVAGTAQPSIEIVGQNLEKATTIGDVIEVTLDHDLI